MYLLLVIGYILYPRIPRGFPFTYRERPLVSYWLGIDTYTEYIYNNKTSLAYDSSFALHLTTTRKRGRGYYFFYTRDQHE